MDPEHTEMSELLEAGLLDDGKYAEAATVAQTSLKRNPNARNHFLDARTLAATGDFAAAERVLRDGLEAAPE